MNLIMNAEEIAEIEKYFGTVADYIEYLNGKIEMYRKHMNDLYVMELHRIFTLDVREMSINNGGFASALQDSKENLISVLESQIKILQNKKEQAVKLI